MIARTLKSQRKSSGTTPLRIMVWAMLLATICGLLGAAEPLEDLLRGGRNMIRARPADQKVVVVGLDEKTYDHFGTLAFSRKYDAILIRNLVAMGARHIYFDRTYSDPTTPEDDNALIDALRSAPGKVSLGVMLSNDKLRHQTVIMAPVRSFRTVAQMATLTGSNKPFSLSAELYYAMTFQGRTIPSVSASIAGYKGTPDTFYRPDWSIQMTTIPTFSFIDILDGKVDASQLRGKDVLVGMTTPRVPDFHGIAGQGWLPGVYFHAVGAQTLREGHPANWGWAPALILAFVMSLLLLRCKTRAGRGWSPPCPSPC
jgi:CHASE2 domain-containing sensor protein